MNRHHWLDAEYEGDSKMCLRYMGESVEGVKEGTWLGAKHEFHFDHAQLDIEPCSGILKSGSEVEVIEIGLGVIW